MIVFRTFLRLNAAQSVSLTELTVAARAKVQELLPSKGAILFRGLPPIDIFRGK